MTALAKLPPLPDTELLTTLGRDAYTDQQMRDYARAAIAALSPAELGGVEAVAWMIDAEFVDAGKVRTFSATKPNPDMWGKATFTPLYATTPRAAEGEKAE